MAKHVASRLSLIAFATSALRGAMTGAGFQDTIQAALAGLAVFYVIGFLLGEISRRLAEEIAQAEFNRLKTEVVQPEPQAETAAT